MVLFLPFLQNDSTAKRRFKSAIEKKKGTRKHKQKMWYGNLQCRLMDTNATPPGTEFMEKLAGEISSWINATENKKLEGIKVVFNSSKLPGEGEHKILNFIRTNANELHGNFVIYGLDADLIMLSMVSGVRDVFPKRRNRV